MRSSTPNQQLVGINSQSACRFPIMKLPTLTIRYSAL